MEAPVAYSQTPSAWATIGPPSTPPTPTNPTRPPIPYTPLDTALDWIGSRIARAGSGIGGALNADSPSAVLPAVGDTLGRIGSGTGGAITATATGAAPAVRNVIEATSEARSAAGNAINAAGGILGDAAGEVVSTFSWIKYAVIAIIAGVFLLLLITALKNNTAARLNVGG